MKNILLLIHCSFFFLNVPSCKAYKGLFISTISTGSHLSFFGGVLEALTENGHKITFITPLEKKLNIENVTQLTLKKNYIEEILGNTFESSTAKIFRSFIKYVPESCSEALSDPQVVEALKEEYDYVIASITFTECFLSYIHEKKIPLIYILTTTVTSPYSERLGIPEFTSATVNKMLAFTFPFTFKERIILTLSSLVTSVYFNYITKSTVNTAKELNLWSPDAPSVWELQNSASLLIINSVKALEYPIKSTPPTVVYAGGIHIKPTKPLPQDLANWLDGSGDAGFILFSLGTAVKSKNIKEEDLKSILNVFRILDQRIIWKWDSKDIEDLPSNVKLSSWLPQQDILAHPKIRLFISHGGLFSTQEATYHEVPVVGMPVFADQKSNVAEIVSEGWGRKMDWNELTEEKFREVVTEVLTNESLREKVHHRSKLMKDWPRKPNEEVTYWVDYVIRHKGAKHLQSPLVHLSWYQIYNIDVWVFISTLVVFILFAFYSLLKICLGFCFKKAFKPKRD